MKNEEVKDYTLLAYFLIQKYCNYVHNKEDLKGDMLVCALEAEQTYTPNPWTSKTTYLTHCMKNYLFSILKKKKGSTRYKSYYLERPYQDIEDVRGPVLESAMQDNHMSRYDAIEVFERILENRPHSRAVELIMERAHTLDLSPAKVFETVLDAKLEDMFLHYTEYSTAMSCKERLILNTSYITHYRYLAKDEELKTLQQLADEYQLSRERIRQLEDASLKFINKRLDKLFLFDFRRDDDICDWRHPWYALREGATADSGCFGAYPNEGGCVNNSW